MKILFGLFLILPIAIVGCASTEDESQLQQGIGACPWDPPKFCWPVQWNANLQCNDACLSVGGDFAYCPEVNSREETTCCGGATPTSSCGACLESIRHTCTGGFEPKPAESTTAQSVENAVCNLPFPVECYPDDASIQCSAACAPNLGYCPEYPPEHVQACQDWCRFGGPTPPYWCEPYWCVPTYPRHCLQGEPALTGDTDE